MMRCSHVRRQLAVYRELSPDEQAQLRQHLAGCPACTAAWEAYRHQDAALAEWAAQPAALAPARDSWARVRARVEAGRATGSSARRRPALVAAIVTLALLLSLAGTARVAADALPGQALYPLKRAAEQARLAFIWTEAGRAGYAGELAQARRKEVAQVVAEKRSARVRWEAVLVAAGGGEWTVDGLSLAVGPQQWAGAPPAAGTLLAVEAVAYDGFLVAETVQVIAGPDAHGPAAGPGGPEGEQGAGDPQRDRDRDNRPETAGTPASRVTPTVTPHGSTPAATATPAPRTPTPTAAPTGQASDHSQATPRGTVSGSSPRATVSPGARATEAATTSAADGNDSHNGNGGDDDSDGDDEGGGSHGADGSPGSSGSSDGGSSGADGAGRKD